MKEYKLIYNINCEEVRRSEFYSLLQVWCKKYTYVNEFIGIEEFNEKKFNSIKRQLLNGIGQILCGENGGFFEIKRIKKGVENKNM